MELLIKYLNLKNIQKGISLRYKIGNINDEKYIYVDVSSIENIYACNSVIASTTLQRLFWFYKFPIIILDELYYGKFTKKEKEFIIYHELGHYKRGHFKRKFEDNYDERLKLEHEADMYAVERTDWQTSYDTLNKIKEVVIEIFGVHETNIDDRVDMLVMEAQYYLNN